MTQATSLTLSKEGAPTLRTKDKPFKKGVLKDAKQTYPSISVKENGRENVLAFFDTIDPELVNEVFQRYLDQAAQEAWKSAVDYDDDKESPSYGTAAKEFDPNVFIEQIISGKARGESKDDMEERLEALMEQLTNLADDTTLSDEQKMKQGLTLIGEVKAQKQRLAEHSAKWEGRRNKNKNAAPTQTVTATPTQG